jgi:hypothetical protein
MALALAAASLASRPHRRTVLTHVLALAVAVDLARGAHGVLFPFLYAHVPGFTGLRVPARAGILILLSLSVLAAIGLATITARASHRVRAVVLVIVAAVCLAEAAPRLRLRTVPAVPSIYQAVPRTGGTVLLELPMRVAAPVDLHGDPTYMFNSIGGWWRLANGYSGYYPASYITLLRALDPFPDSRARDYVARDGITCVLLHERNWRGPHSFGQTAARLAAVGWPVLGYGGGPGDLTVLLGVPPPGRR